MGTQDKVRLTRRDMLKLSAGGAGLFALTASGFAVPQGVGAGGVVIEAFPTSPLILRPFNDPLLSCMSGWPRSARSSGSGWRAPAPMGLAWPAFCAALASS